MNEYCELLKKFIEVPNLCNLLKLISIETWDRIEFARTRNGLKIYETTITQNILFQLRKFSELMNDDSLSMMEAVDEKVNGNDIELVIKTNKGYLLVPLQAKIIYANNSYNAMEHGNQINDLITYAKNLKGIPLYILYNYSSTKSSIKLHGCSLISAKYLLKNYAFTRIDRNGNSKWTIPSFDDLNPTPALPLSILGCCNNTDKSKKKIIDFLGLDDFSSFSKNIKFYSRSEIFENDNWKKTENNFNHSPKKISENKYSPKYRIIIETDNIKL